MTGRVAGLRGARAVGSVLVGLVVAAVLLALFGYPVTDACSALWTGATGLGWGPPVSPADAGLHIGRLHAHLNLFLLAQSLAKATPLLFTGLAIAVGLRGGLFNIGAYGQMTVGALATALVGEVGGQVGHTIGAALALPLALLAGVAAGATWGAIPGLLKATRGVHEVISTIMLNFIAADLTLYLVTYHWKDPSSMSSQTAAVSASARLLPAAFAPGSNLTAGFLLALAAGGGVAFLLARTSLGYRIRAVGLGREAARAAGIPVASIIVCTMAISGGLGGLAGAVEVLGVHHRFVEGVAGTYGFDGIAVALLGGLNGGGVIGSALFFGALSSGSAFMETQTSVPSSISIIVQAIVILFAGMRGGPMDRAKTALNEEQ